jgi:hypothetical protein
MVIKKSFLLCFYFLFVGFLSILFVIKQGQINVKVSLLPIILFIIMFSVDRINKNIINELIFILIYIYYGITVAVLNQKINFFDFTLIYLSYIYALIISLFVGKKLISERKYIIFFKYLLLLFFIKYLYMNIFHITNRPILFMENNFEMMFLLLLYIAYTKYKKNIKLNSFETIILILIVFLSGSRSAIVTLFFILTILNFRIKLSIKNIIKLLLFFIFTFILIYIIFSERMSYSSLESIDRIQFLFYFLNDIHSWGIKEYIMGNPIITPVSNETARNLSYFSSLMSHKHDGSAYSVIYHAFDIRIIYDHGILGLLFLFYFINKVLKISNYDKKRRISIIGVYFLNGLSVSSFGNILGFSGLIFLITIKDFKKEGTNEN